MKKHLKIACILLTLTVMVSFAGCSKDKSAEHAEKTDFSGNAEVSEDYFEWNDNVILSLTESGMEQTEIVIPKRCTGFNGAIFAPDECKVKSLTFESDSDFELNGGLRSSHTLEQIKLPSGLTKISDMEFWRCDSLEEITIPAGITEIGKNAFQECASLKKVVIEGAVTEIKPHTFELCSSLSKIVLPGTVTKIDEYAFFNCNSLKEITLPAGLTEIGGFAFANSGVEKVIVPAELTLEKWDTTSFVQNDHDVEIYVAEGSWMDQNFESVFDGAFNKNYSK